MGKIPNPKAGRSRVFFGLATCLMVSVIACSSDPPPPPEVQYCEALLEVERVRRSARTCFVDERVARQSASLRYPCGGGPASVDFGGSVFSGTVDAQGNVALSLVTSYEHAPVDRCTWETTQRIEGQFAEGKLNYTYREQIVERRGRCGRPCRARARVNIASRSGTSEAK